MTLDWTDEAWRKRWAEFAERRAADRAAHQAEVDRWMASLLEPVAFDELRVEIPLLRYDEQGRAVLGPTVYSTGGSRSDLPERVPDPAEHDGDPG